MSSQRDCAVDLSHYTSQVFCTNAARAPRGSTRPNCHPRWPRPPPHHSASRDAQICCRAGLVSLPLRTLRGHTTHHASRADGPRGFANIGSGSTIHAVAFVSADPRQGSCNRSCATSPSLYAQILTAILQRAHRSDARWMIMPCVGAALAGFILADAAAKRDLRAGRTEVAMLRMRTGTVRPLWGPSAAQQPPGIWPDAISATKTGCGHAVGINELTLRPIVRGRG
jgi:hypothetical protein